jgi:hypothetical protein
MAFDFNTLCTRLGHAMYIGEATQTALKTTVPTRADAFLTGLGSSLGAQFETVRNQILNAQNAFQSAGATSNANLVQRPCQQLILLTVQAEVPSANTIPLAVQELIKLFVDGTESFDASVVASSVSYDAANTGTGVLVASTKRADGKDCLFAFAEAIRFTCNSVNGGQGTFVANTPAVISPLNPTWPGGSGASGTTTGSTASSTGNLVTNGTLEANEDVNANLPLGWHASVGVLGTTLKMGVVQQQTITVTGPPTDGYYIIRYTNAAGDIQATAPLAFDATGSDVQSALNALVGLAGVTVSTTGTTPLYTHTITFTGITYPTILAVDEYTTGGTYTPAISVASSAHVMRGSRSLEFDSSGAENTTIQVPVTLAALSQYAFCCFMKVDSVPAGGVITIDLVDGIGGSVINDDAATANTFTVTASGLTTSFVAKTGVFRTPATMPAQVYLRIRLSTPVSNGTSVFVDEVQLRTMDECYTDGPSVAIFEGATGWMENDIATLTVTNSRNGTFHEYLDRILGLREARLQFPVINPTGSQPDTKVA